MIIGHPLLKSPTEICTTYLIGKQQRASILKKSLWRAMRQLQLIHADIFGPITSASNNNKRYILNFIDDFSRKTCVYFLQVHHVQKIQSLC